MSSSSSHNEPPIDRYRYVVEKMLRMAGGGTNGMSHSQMAHWLLHEADKVLAASHSLETKRPEQSMPPPRTTNPSPSCLMVHTPADHKADAASRTDSRLQGS